MTRRRTGLALAAGLAGLAWIGWGVYVDRTTDRVPSELVRTFDGVEVRRYPELAVARTTAPDEGAAFGRLFRYITGANREREDVPMTAPVATRGSEIAMTTPVATEATDDGVTMSFYLPDDYTAETAPEPTNDAVTVEPVAAATVAALPFSWYATDRRVERKRRRLLETLADAGIATTGRPLLWQYDDPWTPPFMRHNEVAVPVDPDTVDPGPDGDEGVTIPITDADE